MAVRFCPLLFELGKGLEGEGSPFELPYKMVLAVATSDSVMLYDTSGQAPFAVLGSLHPDRAPITDIAWSCDGRFLATSSMDGAPNYSVIPHLPLLHCAFLWSCDN